MLKQKLVRNWIHYYNSLTKIPMEYPSGTNSSSSASGVPTNTHEPNQRGGILREIIHFSIIALVIVLPIRMFVAQPFIVSGASMDTTFASGQYLIVDQLTYHFEAPKRGDVIVFRYPKDPSKFFIKRIIGIPGDTVSIAGSVVTVSNKNDAKGTVLKEPYILSMAPNATLTETLEPGKYFVMGDNRDASSDSRMWGVVPRENIVGRALIRLFPFTKLGLLPGSYDINSEMTSS